MKNVLRVVLAVMITTGLMAAPALANWTASTSLSLKASDTTVKQGTKVTFTIHLKSSRAKCYQNQPIKWFKNGVYKKTVTTNANGIVKLTKKMHNTSTYRAKYLGRRWGTHPHRKTCYASQSKAVTITVNK